MKSEGGLIKILKTSLRKTSAPLLYLEASAEVIAVLFAGVGRGF